MNENVSIDMYLNILVPIWWNCLEWSRQCGLVGDVGVGLEVSKVHTILGLSLLRACGANVRHELLASCCWPCSSPMMVMDLAPAAAGKPK